MNTSLIIEGMSCEHCVASVKQALEAVDGVVEANIDLQSGVADISGDSLADASLKQAVIDAGYQVK